MDRLKMHSPDLTQANIDKLAELFPNCMTESAAEDGSLKRAVDFDLLRQELSGSIVEGPQERYQLNWPGKKDAVLLSNTAIARTLRPCENESVNFDNTGNLFIEGDNLDALKLLQETYLGKIKLVYIDPPYNTGSDLVYLDDFSTDKDSYLIASHQLNGDGSRLVANIEANGRFHSSWASMILPRLKLTRTLLKDDGLLYISIDDNELHNLRKMCDEVFGPKNFVGILVVNSTPNARDYGHIGKMHEYVLFYAKDIEQAKSNLVPTADKTFAYEDQLGGFNIHPLYNSNVAFHSGNRPNLYYPFYLKQSKPLADGFFEIGLENVDGAVEIFPPRSQREGVQFVWRWGKPKAKENLNSEIVGYRTGSGEYRIVQKMRHSSKLIRSLLLDTAYSTRRGTAEVESLFGKKLFSFPKPLELMKLLLSVGMDSSDTVLDMFAGSCTLAHAAMVLNAEDGGNRRYIAIQIPEQCDDSSVALDAGYSNIAQIAKERIRLAGEKVKLTCATTVPELDTGFRVLKIDTSNMKDVYYAPDALAQGTLLDQIENIKEDRTSGDLLFQVLLDWGVDLSFPISREFISGKSIYSVDGNGLVACFDKDVSEDLIKAIAAKKPLRAVFRDAGFSGDSAKINVEQIFKLVSPSTELRCI